MPMLFEGLRVQKIYGSVSYMGVFGDVHLFINFTVNPVQFVCFLLPFVNKNVRTLSFIADELPWNQTVA